MKPQEVAVKATIVIRRIIYPGKPNLGGIRLEVATGCVNERPNQPPGTEPVKYAYASDSRRSTAAHQVQEQCLRLVVEVVGTQQPVTLTDMVPKGRVPRLSGGRFQAASVARVYLNGLERELDLERLAQLPAMLAPCGGVPLESMVDVNGQQRFAVFTSRLRKRVGQHG